jgi:IclR family transcriptional regulator, acetate operon repressor
VTELARDPLEKTTEILRQMIDSGQPSWGVRELGRAVRRPPSTVSRSLSRLESQGLVAVDGAGRYSLGLEMHRLAAKVAARFSLRDTAMPALIALHRRFDETAFLGLADLQRREMMLACSVESTQELRHVVTVHEWRPLWLGASGLAILAFLEEPVREEVLRTMTPGTSAGDQLITEGHVREMIELARERGYARTIGERAPDAVGLAAPVRDAGGRVVGSAGMTLPSSRFAPEREPELAEAVIATAERVTRNLG